MKTLWPIAARLMLVTSFTICTGFLGCGGDTNTQNTPPPAAANPGSPPNGGVASSAWTQTRESTTCEAMANQYCKGAFGFTVKNTGQYVLGPTSDGQTITGTIQANELATITADANAVAAEDLNAAPVCAAGSGIPGVGDEIFLSTSDTTEFQIYQLSIASFCYRGSQAAATKLQTDLRTLMNKYYVTPFPALTVNNGHWGGVHVDMDVTSSGATLRLDCAKANIPSALLLDNSNRFSQAGTVTSTAGPIVVDHPHPDLPAQFTGSVSGNTMSLTVSYKTESGTNQTDTYSLTSNTNGTHPGLCAL